MENRTAAPRHDGTSVWSEVLWSSRDLEWVDLGDMRDIVRERGNIPGSEMVLLVGRMGERSIIEAYVDIWIWVVKGVLRAEVVCSVSVSVDSRHHGVVGGHEGVVAVVAESGHRGDSQRRPVPILVVVVFSERFMRGLPRLSQVKSGRAPVSSSSKITSIPFLFLPRHFLIAFLVPHPYPHCRHLARPRRPLCVVWVVQNAGESRLCHPQNGWKRRWKRRYITPRFSA